MRERDIEAYLVKRVRAMGGEVRKVQWIGRRGAPDRLVMIARRDVRTGHFGTICTFWVELKAPGLKAKSHQAREHDRMRKMGQIVVVIDSLAAVDELLA